MVSARKLVGDRSQGLLRQRGQSAVEEPAAVAEPVALRVPAVHGQQDCLRIHFRRVSGVRDIEGPFGKPHPGMPFAKNERCFRGHNHGQGGQRSPLAQRSGKMAGVVLALNRPAEGETAASRPGNEREDKRLCVCATLRASRVQARRARDEALALGATPGFERRCIHGRGSGSFMILKVFRNLAAALACTWLPQVRPARPPRMRTKRCSAPMTRTGPATRSNSPVTRKTRRARPCALARVLAPVDAA